MLEDSNKNNSHDDNKENNSLANTLGAITNALSQIAQHLDNNEQEGKETRKEVQETRKETRMAITEVRRDLGDFKGNVRDEIAGIKDSQYLEPYQAAKVQEAAKTRVASLLRDWCRDSGKDSEDVFGRYFGKFVRLVHTDAKKVGLEIGKIVYTPKKNYAMLLEFIGEWYPTRGIQGQMEHYDNLDRLHSRSR